MATKAEIVARTVRALAQATAEHGRPNNFTPGWLSQENGAPRPMLQGRFAEDIVQAAKAVGLEVDAPNGGPWGVR